MQFNLNLIYNAFNYLIGGIIMFGQSLNITKNSYLNCLIFNLINIQQVIQQNTQAENALIFASFVFYKKHQQTKMACQFVSSNKKSYFLTFDKQNLFEHISLNHLENFNSKIFMEWSEFKSHIDDGKIIHLETLEQDNKSLSNTRWLSNCFGIEKRMRKITPLLIIPYIGSGNKIDFNETLQGKSYSDVFGSLDYYAFSKIFMQNEYNPTVKMESNISVIAVMLYENKHNPSYSHILEICGSDDGFFESNLNINTNELIKTLKEIYELLYAELLMLTNMLQDSFDEDYWKYFVSNKYDNKNIGLLVDVFDCIFEKSNLDFELYNNTSKIQSAS